MNIHILGGGIGGMSAALHLGRLREQGLIPSTVGIHLLEASTRLGGKAMSQFGRPDAAGQWPGEHGFRFFPNFYRCMPDTLKRIPLTAAHKGAFSLRPDLGDTAFAALTASDEGGMGVGGKIIRIDRSPSLAQLPTTVGRLLAQFHVTPLDVARYTTVLTRFLCTCQDRALETWEHRTLDDFVTEHGFSAGMQDFLRSLRALSAMRASRGSLRTLLFTSVQLLADFDPEYHLWDALLPAPTDHLMLIPWQDELVRLGVAIEFGRRVTGLAFQAGTFGQPGRLASVDTSAGPLGVAADDVVVLAIPWEAARPLLDAAPNLPSTLAGIREVPQRADNLGDGSEPMVGVQFWLRHDVPMVKGHMVYPGAPWAITSISQGQFWRATYTKPLSTVFAAPGLEGILSAIVSAWDAVAPRLGKAPKDCDPLELAQETFAQIREASGASLDWSDVIAWHVDSDIQFSPNRAHCPTPLWVSPAGSYLHRPLPDPGVGNLFVASDWARTETDVGSMESADEAARWAVRAIARGLPVPPPEHRLPEVRPIRLWASLEVMRAVDQWMYDHGLGHALDLNPAVRRGMTRILQRLQAGDDVRDHADDWVAHALGAGARGEVRLPSFPGSGVLGRVIDVFSRFGRARWGDGGADQDLLDALDEP